MSLTIESLGLEIYSNSQSAIGGIDTLAKSLGALKTSVKGGLGLSSVAKQIGLVGSAVSEIQPGSTTKIEGLAKAIQLLGGLKISSTISNQITSITAALNGMNIDSSATTKIQELVSTLQPLTQMGKSNLSSFLTPLKKLPETIAELNKVDMTAFKNKIQEVTNAVKPLADEMNKVAAGFSAFPTKIQKLISSTNTLTTTNNKASMSYINLYAKLKMAIAGVMGVVKGISSSIRKTNEYIENMNLFTVSMGSYADEAKQYADVVEQALGIDPSEWMRNQGLFMTLATGFGVASDRANIMSKNLTQLGYDLSSFFNISYAESMQKLQSGLAGELEPLRRIGFDLSQAKLEAVALSLGIDKTVSSMTQAEKAELRYYAIMTQVTAAHGDMARTLNAPANQLKVLKSQVNMAARAIGSIFIPALNAILPYAIAAVKVFRYLAEAVAALFGFEMPEVDYSGVESMAGVGEDVANSMENATDSAKKLKSYMMGFDELNVINPGNDGASDNGGGSFDFKLPEYDFLEGLADSRVNQIVDEMKEWLGITGDIDSWSDLFETRLGNILQLVGLIGAGIAAWKVTKGFIDSITTIKTLLSNPTYTIAISATVVIVGLAIAFTGMVDAIKDGLNKINFGEIVGGALLGTGGAALFGSKIAGWITTSFAHSAVSKALTTAAINLFGQTAGPITAGAITATGAILAASVAAVIVGIPMYFVGIYDAIKDKLDWLNGLLIGAGATLAGAGIGAIIGALGGPIGAGVGALIGLAVGLITDFGIWFWQQFDKIEKWFMNLPTWVKVVAIVVASIVTIINPIYPLILGMIAGVITVIKKWDDIVPWVNKYVIQPVVNFFKGLWESVSGFFTNLWDDIVGVWNTVATWFNENVIQPVVRYFTPIGQTISQIFEGCWLIIQAVWVVASEWFNTWIITPIVTAFNFLKELVVGAFKLMWEDIKKRWEKVATFFKDFVVTPIAEAFTTLKTLVVGFFKFMWEDIKTRWGKVSKWFNDTVGEPLRKVFEGVSEAIKEVFSALWLNVKKTAVNAMNGVIGGVESAINGVIGGINGLIGGFDKVVQWAAEVLGKNWGGITLVQEVKFKRIPVPTFAEGGFPESGQAFIARENGIPEMVGTIGRRTAVANNEQIVESVASGVAEANGEQNALLREQNALLRALLEKDNGVYLDGRSLSNSVDKYRREQGRVVIAGGAL